MGVDFALLSVWVFSPQQIINILSHSTLTTEVGKSVLESVKHVQHKKMLLDLTDVCPLLTKQYIQVGLQIQYIYMLYNFLDGLSLHTWYG